MTFRINESRSAAFMTTCGTLLYVPAAAVWAEPGHACSGWAHTVENLEDSLSVNHNWINGYNISWVWDYLQQQRSLAEAAVLAEDAVQACRCGDAAVFSEMCIMLGYRRLKPSPYLASLLDGT